MKVKATGEFKRLGVNPKELDYIPEEGKVFEVSEERFKVLKGNNAYRTEFVKEIEVAKKEVKTEKAVRKTTKKSK